MVGGLQGFQVTDSKCQEGEMPQGRHRGACVFVHMWLCLALMVKWIWQMIPEDLILVLLLCGGSGEQTERVEKGQVCVWSCVFAQSVNECKYINAPFHLRVLTVLNVSVPEWRLHFSLPLYTEVTRFSGLKNLFSWSPFSFCVSSPVPISPIPKLFHEQSLRGRVVTQPCTLLSPFFSLSFHLFKHSGGKGFGEMETTTW